MESVELILFGLLFGRNTHISLSTTCQNTVWSKRSGHGRDISSPAIWAAKISAHFGDNSVAQMSRQICSHTPSALNAGGHASMLLHGEGSEATEPYNKYANLFQYISYLINLINPFGRHFCRPCDQRHIVAQIAGDEMSLAQNVQLVKPQNTQLVKIV